MDIPSDPIEQTIPAGDSLAAAHHEITALFDQVRAPDADRPAALQALVRRLAAHANAEDQHLVPALEAAGAPDAAAALGDANRRSEKILASVERRSASSPDMVELVTELEDIHRSHLARFEDDVEPLLLAGGALGGDEALAGRVARALADKDAHPHPLLPGRGPLGRVGRAVASAVDATRNRTVDR